MKINENVLSALTDLHKALSAFSDLDGVEQLEFAGLLDKDHSLAWIGKLNELADKVYYAYNNPK